MAKKMIDVERENTKFNVIEVVTEFNVPQSAKVVLSKNDMWESEQRNDFDDYWMGSTAVEHWSTKGKHAMQANHYIFFQKV